MIFATMLLMLSYAKAQNINIRQGEYSSGTVLYNWDKSKLRKGEYSSGSILHNFDGEVPAAILIHIVE